MSVMEIGVLTGFVPIQESFEKVANHPERIKNLFFLYSVLLRAFNLAQPII